MMSLRIRPYEAGDAESVRSICFHTALLDRFVAHMHECGVAGIRVSVESQAGKAFFSKHGFKTAVAYQAPSLFDLPPQEAWIMTRE